MRYNICEVKMGLDGISINQLRITPENNSAEANRINRLDPQNDHKIVDSLSSGQKIDPDKEREKQQEGEFEFNENENENTIIEDTEVVKYDLSESSKYILKLDSESNNILIVEKATSKIVQKINADELANYVGFLSNSQGSIVNRKF